MNKTAIEWTNYTWNPVTGCKNGCWYCYGKRIRERFNPGIPWTQLMHFDERLEDPIKVKKPVKIFVGSMTDMLAPWYRDRDVKYVLEVIKRCPQHTFQFLTKNPERYAKYNFPKNCWLGTTVTCEKEKTRAITLKKLKVDNVKFVSLEPLMDESVSYYNFMLDWVIIGAMTGAGSHKYRPKKEYVELLIKVARETEVPLFLKNNLKWKEEIKEYPCDKRTVI